MSTAPRAARKEVKWTFGFVGVLAIGTAAGVQFALGDLDPDTEGNLPELLSVLHAFAGKLALTVPLATIGLCLLLRDVLTRRNGHRQAAPVARTEPRAARPPVAELETGEPLPEEGGPRIAAVRGRFGDAPAGGPTDGQVALASEKYLNKNAGPPDFRKGKTVVRKGGV